MSDPRENPMPAPERNRLLRALSPDALARLRPRLERVELVVKATVLLPDAPVEFVHFVESGTVSMISILEDGAAVEVGLVGSEGFLGLPVLLGAPTSPMEALVQVAGTALRLPAAEFRAALEEVPGLLAVLLRYVDSFHVQVSQSATCNAHHHIEPRLARWLLMTHDRVEGDRFSMTHEFISYMLGVHRPGVTIAVGGLQRAGLVRHEKGVMEVLDRAGLEAASCECYAHVRRRMEWIMGPPQH